MHILDRLNDKNHNSLQHPHLNKMGPAFRPTVWAVPGEAGMAPVGVSPTDEEKGYPAH
jgi:hypothetical protein